MTINIMTLFPDMFTNFLSESILGRAIKNKIIDVNLYNIRDYSKFKSKSVDDYVYGGGEGMLMRVEPIYDCYKDIVGNKKKVKVIFPSPTGKILNQNMSMDFAKEDELIFLCGHYEGVDKRALDLLDVIYVSIGDYILTGGELATMVIIDSTIRFIDGVLSNENSPLNDSFNNNLLECPQYTRPREYKGLKVPDVLLSGDHERVASYRLEESIRLTKERRPDLYKEYLNNK